MVKKSLLFLVMIILLSGCTANYNLKIDKGKVIENLSLNGVDVSKFKNTYVPIDIEADDPNAFKKKFSDVDYYDMNIKNNSVILKYNHSYESFFNSYILNSCYEGVDSYVYDNKFIISTIGKFTCFDNYDNIDNVNVIINSQYKLVNSNANKIDGFNYIWNINKNNIYDGIYLELDLTDRKKNLIEKLESSKLFNCLVFVGVIVIILVLFYLFRFYSELKDKV